MLCSSSLQGRVRDCANTSFVIGRCECKWLSITRSRSNVYSAQSLFQLSHRIETTQRKINGWWLKEEYSQCSSFSIWLTKKSCVWFITIKTWHLFLVSYKVAVKQLTFNLRNEYQFSTIQLFESIIFKIICEPKKNHTQQKCVTNNYWQHDSCISAHKIAIGAECVPKSHCSKSLQIIFVSTIGPPKVMRRVDISLPTLDLRQQIELCVLEKSSPNLLIIKFSSVGSSTVRMGHAIVSCIHKICPPLIKLVLSVRRSPVAPVRIFFLSTSLALAHIGADMHNIIIIINGKFCTQSNFKCTVFGFCLTTSTSSSASVPSPSRRLSHHFLRFQFRYHIFLCFLRVNEGGVVV